MRQVTDGSGKEAVPDRDTTEYVAQNLGERGKYAQNPENHQKFLLISSA